MEEIAIPKKKVLEKPLDFLVLPRGKRLDRVTHAFLGKSTITGKFITAYLGVRRVFDTKDDDELYTLYDYLYSIQDSDINLSLGEAFTNSKNFKRDKILKYNRENYTEKQYKEISLEDVLDLGR